MRVERLDLTRYGRFTDASLAFPPPAPGAPDLHVVFGPNEAGKSTLFSAWLDLLYGIPTRSRYDFLHPGPTMQIGARLTHAGGVLDAVRVKRNGQSLQDATGAPLPEAVMQAALAGLGREGYGAMFSLDDDTLEKGGDSILASRGDLGEMLFSASAGLAGLGPQLETLRKAVDDFHKPRARTSILRLARDRLEELDRQRRDLDTTATAAQKLQREVGAAETAWKAARAAETAAETALGAITAALAVVPQQARLARLRADLAPLADLPDATDTDLRQLLDIETALEGLAGSMSTRADALAELAVRRAALALDPAILPLADRIAEAAALHPMHLAAMADLPRRRDSLSALAADILRLRETAGLAGDASGHALPPPLLARLRALVARRDTAMQAQATAAQEMTKAEARLRAAEASAGPIAPVQDLHSLAHLVARLRAADPAASLRRAQADLDARDGDLDRALLACAPWRGSALDLASLSVPAPWDIAAWEAADLATARALRAASDTRDRRRADLAALQQAAPPAAPGAPTLTDAAQARRLREAAWADHLARLTPETAATFEAALRVDDRISQHLADAMADARHQAEAALTLARRASELAEAETALQTSLQARQAHEQAVTGALAGLGLGGAGLADLRRWLEARDKVLVALQTRDQARHSLALATTALTDAARALAGALALPADLGLDRLMAEALARLDSADRQDQAARHLAQMQADLTDRRADLTRADGALTAWAQDWATACADTPLATSPPQDPGLAALLDTLDQLSRLQADHAGLAARIAKMEANSKDFHDAAQRLLAELALPAETPWPTIPERLSRAQQAARDDAGIAADLARDLAAQAQAQARADVLAARRQALADRLGWHGTPALGDHLAACHRAAQLRRDIAELAAELAHHPDPPADAPALEAEAARAKDALALARSESEARLATLAEARRLLRAVGGDDAVARLAAERANLINDLQDQARSHLARRFALMAFEQGLRRYRDSHRSAMLARASDAFCQLGRGAYAGLAAQADGPAEVLVALPQGGGAKLATDLSKGTRFQLYLALRIAGYHELARSRPPVPFIADDIMETFDDDRAAQAFVLLGDMARTGQVIYLTHHRHLCDIALAACPGARIIDLAPLQRR